MPTKRGDSRRAEEDDLASRTVVLVMAHKPKPLPGLFKLLDPRFRCFVHYNARCDVSEVMPLPAHVSFIGQRFRVFWGGFSMMLAIRALVDEAYRAAPGFERAILISGDSLPLFPGDALEDLLADERREYIGLAEVPNDPGLRGRSMMQGEADRVLPWRFQNFSFGDDELANPRTLRDAMLRYGISETTASHLRGSVQAMIGAILGAYPPRARLYERFYYGEAWWALTRGALDLIVDDLHDPRHVDFFRLLQVPEEHFVPTLLGNRERALTSLGRQIVCSPVFVDHDDPERAVPDRDALSAEGFRRAREAGPYLFARKFDPDRTPEIADAVEAGTYFGGIIG